MAARSAIIKRISFSGCGWLSAFHFGVGEALRSAGILDESTVFAGASGGTLAAVGFAAGLSGQELLEIQLSASRRAKEVGRGRIPVGRLHGILRDEIDNALPADWHKRIPGRIDIRVLRLWPKPSRDAMAVTSFVDRADLIDCMLASGYIPGYIGLRPVLSWRRMGVIDGGLVHAVPKGDGLCVFPFLVPPENMGVEHGREYICPLSSHWVPGATAIKYMFFPPDDNIQQWVYKAGAAAAENWVSRQDNASNVFGVP